MTRLDPTGGAAAVVFDDVGRVLLVKENYGRRRRSLPGGALDDGETPEQAAVREAYEETGVRVAIEYLIGQYELDDGFAAYAFRCRIIEGTPTLPDTGEIAAVEWHPVDALPHPRSNVLHYAVPDAVAGARGVVRRRLPRVT